VSNTQTATHFDVLKDSTLHTFGAICGSEPVLRGPDSPDDHNGGVCGIVSMLGDVSLSLSLSFPPDTAEQIAVKFSGFDIPYDSDDMNDVIGELANTMAGDVVARLDRRGVKVKMSLPTVARGARLEIGQPGASDNLRIQFDLPQGPMVVGLAVGRP
jgi:CheY-specific phosphatase CheX